MNVEPSFHNLRHGGARVQGGGGKMTSRVLAAVAPKLCGAVIVFDAAALQQW
jgi:hypothetical protein